MKHTMLVTVAVAASLVGACSAPNSSGARQLSAATPSVLPCIEPGRWRVTSEIVSDTQEGNREWEREMALTPRSESEGAVYCAGLALGDRGGWRLPTAAELQSILLRPVGIGDETDACSPSIDQEAFPRTPEGGFWTSSVPLATGDVGAGMYTGFDDGRTHPTSREVPMLVRCVRDAASDL